LTLKGSTPYTSAAGFTSWP